MRWRQARRSDNVEDRRGRRMSAGTGVKLGGGAVLLIAVVAWLTGQDLGGVLDLVENSQVSVGGGAGGYPSGRTEPAPEAYDERAEFLRHVLGTTEDTWSAIFAAEGQRYVPPTLVMFDGAVDSACGYTSAAVGPFYCPADQKVYIDLSFLDDLHTRFGAPGDFAQAYVIAHEVGHHIQKLTGISDQVDRLRGRLDETQANALSVLVELQADCYAGVWGYHANRQQRLLEPGDVEEGLRAAAAIGDDRLQRQAGGYVNPETWTHGSSRQRVEWLRRGLESGRLDRCDTFAAEGR